MVAFPWFETDSLSPFRNMAIDEAFFLRKIQMLRFYRWSEKTFSMGYFQKVNLQDFDVPVVRRMTGGGIVEHGKDLTFSVVMDLKTFPFLELVKKSYYWIHQSILNALMNLNIHAQFYNDIKGNKGNFCFQTPSQDDLIVGSQKIVGGAQRRRGSILLHQGTIALDPIGVDRARLIQEILKGFAGTFQLDLKEGFDMLSGLENDISCLEKKYQSGEWTCSG